MKQTDLPLIFYYIVACVAVASALAPSNAAAMCRADWISPIEGVYTLQEWHTEAGVLAPPTVDGRLIFSNGAVGITGHNNADEAKKISFALFGIYLTEGCQFSYRYTTNSTFTETPTDITASRTLPWEGMRVFTSRPNRTARSCAKTMGSTSSTFRRGASSIQRTVESCASGRGSYGSDCFS